MVLKLRSEFFTSIPDGALSGCSAEVIEEAVSAYVDTRLTWEVQNRGAIDIYIIVSVLTVPIGIGIIGMRLIDRAERKIRYHALHQAELVIRFANEKNA